MRKMLLSYPEVARIAGVSLSSIRRMAKRGELRTVTLGRSRRVPRSEVDRLVARVPVDQKRAASGATGAANDVK